MKIAIPSVLPGGLEAQVGAHFGHCDCYTLVDVEDGAVVKSEVIPSCAHEHGGCLAPVNFLADRGVTVLLAGGMGMRPLMGFLQEGVDVYYAAGIETVEKAVAAHIAGELPRFSPNHSCGGGHHCKRPLHADSHRHARGRPLDGLRRRPQGRRPLL